MLSLYITGPHCAARPFQVYLISGIARWNADRAADSVYGKKGRNNRIYSSPLIQRLNSRCKDLFGEHEIEEPNYRAPAISSDELLGLEYLFDQSTSSENPSLSVDELQQDGPSAEEEVTLDMDADEGFEDVDNNDMVQPSPPVNLERIVITTNTKSESLNPFSVSRNICLIIIYAHTRWVLIGWFD